MAGAATLESLLLPGARALLAHGMPGATRDLDDPDWVVIGGRRKRFSDEVTDVLLGVRDPE